MTPTTTAFRRFEENGTETVSVAQSWATTCHDCSRSYDLADTPAVRARTCDAARATSRGNDFTLFSASAWTTRADYDNGACLEWSNAPTAEAPSSAAPNCPTCRSSS